MSTNYRLTNKAFSIYTRHAPKDDWRLKAFQERFKLNFRIINLDKWRRLRENIPTRHEFSGIESHYSSYTRGEYGYK